MFPSLSKEEILFYYAYVRKFLHFTVYAILGFFAFRACVSGRQGAKGSRYDDASSLTVTRTLMTPLLISLAVALTDEYIQSLDTSRTSSLFDVAIDMLGALTVVTVMRFVSPVSSRAKKV